MTLLFFLRYWKKKKEWKYSDKIQFIPGALIVVILSTLLSYGLNDRDLFDIIGDIKTGLPDSSTMFKKNITEFKDFINMLPTALVISIVAFIESFAVSSKIADARGYQINGTQQLIALGFCNLIAAWFQSYPTTGSLSRTAIGHAAGSTTPVASLIAGLFMLFALAVFVQLFEWLPKPTLAAIVLVGVSNLFDTQGMKELWQLKRNDFYVMGITFIITLALGVEIGVGTGVLASLFMFLQRSATPHYAILGHKSTDTHVFENVKNHPSAILPSHLVILRWDANLFFGNIESFEKAVRKHIWRFLYRCPEINGGQMIDKCGVHPDQGTWGLLLCFSGVNDVDATAAQDLDRFLIELKKKNPGMIIMIACIKKPVKKVLSVTRVIEDVGVDRLFLSVDLAVTWFENYLRGADSKNNVSNSNSNNNETILLNVHPQTSDELRAIEMNNVPMGSMQLTRNESTETVGSQTNNIALS